MNILVAVRAVRRPFSVLIAFTDHATETRLGGEVDAEFVRASAALC